MSFPKQIRLLRHHREQKVAQTCKHWMGIQRAVYADNHSESVFPSEALYRRCTRFIGTVKNTTRRFPMRALTEYLLEGRGDSSYMVSTFSDGFTDLKMDAVSWVDLNRRYFVAISGKITGSKEQACLRWKKRDGFSTQEIQFVPIPHFALDYHSCASMIDRHNQTLEDDIGIERSFQIKYWPLRVNCILLGMCIIDTSFLYVIWRGVAQHLSEQDFFVSLSQDLIENSYYSKGLLHDIRQSVSTEESTTPSQAVGDACEYLTPTSILIGVRYGNVGKAWLQRRCGIFGFRFYRKLTFSAKWIWCKERKMNWVLTTIYSTCRVNPTISKDTWNRSNL